MSNLGVHEIKTCGELCVALVNCGWWPRNDAQHERIKAVWDRIVHLPAAEPKVEYWQHIDIMDLQCKTVDGVIRDHTPSARINLLGVGLNTQAWVPITAAEYEAAKARASGKPADAAPVPPVVKRYKGVGGWVETHNGIIVKISPSIREADKGILGKPIDLGPGSAWREIDQWGEPVPPDAPKPTRIERLEVSEWVTTECICAKINELVDAVNELRAAK